MLELFQIFSRWKKYILGFTFVAILLSIIITFPAIIPPKFESKMIFYVANPLSTDRANLFNQKDGGIVSQFGGRNDADRFIAICTSSDILGKMIKEFNLVSHYKIDKKSAELNFYYAKKELQKNLNIKRNDNDAIEISCLDTDPKLAAEIVRFLVQNANTANLKINKDNKQKVLSELDVLIHEKNEELPNLSGIEKESAIASVFELKNLKNQYLVSLNESFTSIYIIEDAAVAIKKSYPVRWQIVLLTAVFAFSTAFFFAVVYQLYEQNAKSSNI